MNEPSIFDVSALKQKNVTRIHSHLEIVVTFLISIVDENTYRSNTQAANPNDGSRVSRADDKQIGSTMKINVGPKATMGSL